MSFRFLTAGESHGKALVGILEGVPSHLPVTSEQIQFQMRRRKLGLGRSARQKMEEDEVEILSGIRHGETLGSPIALMIRNRDWQNWQDIMQAEPLSEPETGALMGEVPMNRVRRRLEVPRPGHADYVGGVKYAHEDMRSILERASARETAMRVAIGTIARLFLERLGISIGSRVVQVGDLRDPQPLDLPVQDLNARVDPSPLRVLNSQVEDAMVRLVETSKKQGETLGGVFEVVASGVPLGLGSHVQWDRRLDGRIGEAFMSLNAIKGVEIGEGFQLGAVLGSQAHDAFFPHPEPRRVHYQTNRSGGIDGGITTGQPIRIRAAMKPLATLMAPLPSVHLQTGEPALAHVERSDVCAVPAAAVIGESILALTLAQAVLEKFGGDSLDETRSRVKEWAQGKNED